MLKPIIQIVEQVVIALLTFSFYLIGNDIAGSVVLIALILNQTRIDNFSTPVIEIPTTCVGNCPNCTKHSKSK